MHTGQQQVHPPRTRDHLSTRREIENHLREIFSRDDVLVSQLKTWTERSLKKLEDAGDSKRNAELFVQLTLLRVHADTFL